jgi:hypothetical protein
MATPIKSNILRREVAQRNFQENAIENIELVRGYDIMSVGVRVSGTVTLGSGANGVQDLAPAQLIDSLEMFSDGSKNLEETTGRLAGGALFERGFKRRLTAPGTGASQHQIEGVFRLDRANFDGPRPKDSALHTTQPFMSLLQMRVRTGQVADMFDGGSVSDFDLDMSVFQDEIQEFTDQDAMEPKMIRRVSLQSLPVTADNSRFEVKLPVGSYLRGVKLIALDDTGNLSNDVINSVQLKSGVNVRQSLPFDQLRAENAQDYGIDETEALPGIVYADLCPDGKLNKLFDLTAASEASAVLDVSKPAGGNGQILANIVEYIPQAGANG